MPLRVELQVLRDLVPYSRSHVVTFDPEFNKETLYAPYEGWQVYGLLPGPQCEFISNIQVQLKSLGPYYERATLVHVRLLIDGMMFAYERPAIIWHEETDLPCALAHFPDNGSTVDTFRGWHTVTLRGVK